MKTLLERIKFVAIVDLQREGAAQEKEQCPDVLFPCFFKKVFLMLCVCVCEMLIYVSIKVHIMIYVVHHMPSGVL